MTKKPILKILLVAECALIIVGILFLIWMLNAERDRNYIEIYLSEGETESVGFEELCLVPGQSCQYKVVLKTDDIKQFQLSIDFEQVKESPLKDYAYVRITSNDEVVTDMLLSNAFESDSIHLAVDFTQNVNTELTVIYYLPLEVGNEAKGAEAFFNLLLTAGKE